MISANRGIEYVIELNPDFDTSELQAAFILQFRQDSRYILWPSNACIIIANVDKTDERLLETEYYKSQKESWFDIRIPNYEYQPSIDAKLTEKEQTFLDFILNYLKDNNHSQELLRHGWFDVAFYR